MIRLNTHYAELKESYLFAGIAKKRRRIWKAIPGRSSTAWASGTFPSRFAPR